MRRPKPSVLRDAPVAATYAVRNLPTALIRDLHVHAAQRRLPVYVVFAEALACGLAHLTRAYAPQLKEGNE